MYSMPATPLTCCSIGSATVSITVLALAPGYLVVTEIVGGTTLGYCEIGSRIRETRPMRTNTKAKTLERTGRSMKNRENMRLPSVRFAKRKFDYESVILSRYGIRLQPVPG